MSRHGGRGVNWCFRLRELGILCIVLPTLIGCNRGQSQQQAQMSNSERTVATTVSAGSPQASQTELRSTTGDPISAVKTFLEAVRTGDDEKVVSLFSEEARKQAGQLNRQFAPVGSDTARYQVFEDVQYLAPDGARVRTHWTDLDSRGQPRTDEITWMLRKEDNGWRIAGMATVIFEGEPPLLLDFENMQETLRKVEMLSQEIERRQQSQATTSNNQHDENAPAAIRPTEGSPEGTQQNVTTRPLPNAPDVSADSTMTALKPDEPVSRN